MDTIQKATYTLTAYATVTTDITADLLSPVFGDAEIGIDAEDRIQSTGTLEFELDNHRVVGKYLPTHSNCLAGWKKGTPVEIQFTYDSEVVTERYYVDDCQVSGALEERIKVVAVDWFEFAARHPVVLPDLLENATGDEGITELLSAFPIPPQDTDLDTGINVFPTLLDNVTRYTKAYSSLSQIAYSEPGYIYLQKPETLRFENLLSRNGTRTLSKVPVHSELSDYLHDHNSNNLTDENSNLLLLSMVEDVSLSTASHNIIRYKNNNGKNVVNRFTTTAHPRRTDEEPILLYRPERPIYIPSGGTLSFREYFTDPVSRRGINAVPPDEEGDIKFLAHFEGSVGGKQSLSDELGRALGCFDVELVDDVFGTAPKFGETCLYLDGTASYLTIPFSSYWELTTQNFLFDWWEYRFNTTTAKTTFSRDGTIAVPPFRFGRSNGTSLLIDISSNGSSFDIANGKDMGTITTGQWVHFRIVRMGSSFYSFKNGGLEDSWTSSGSIFASTEPLYIGRNQSTYMDCTLDEIMIRVGGQYTTESFTPPTSAYTLQGTFLTANTAEDQSGTDFSDDVTITADYGTEGAVYELENTSQNNGYVSLKTYGYGIHLDSPTDRTLENQTSIDTHGYQNGSLDMGYAQDVFMGTLEAGRVIEQEKEPRLILEEVEMSANRSSSDMMRFLHLGLGDLVECNIENTEKDAYFWIQGRKYALFGGGAIKYTWKLREHFSYYKGLDDLAVEFAGGSATDAIVFPYMPYVCGDDVTSFSISLWFYQDTQASSNFYFLAGPFMDSAGSMVYIQQDASNRKIGFYTSRFNVSPGTWNTPTNQYSLSAWVHLVVTWNLSVSSDPVVYINGTSQSMTETSTPAGTLQTAVGCPFFIGNVKTPTYNYSRSFDGKIRDVRYFRNTEITQANVNTIYNSGTYSPTVGLDIDGMVFQAPGVYSSRYTAYQNATLTDEDKVIDNYLLVAGTPNGSPVARVP